MQQELVKGIQKLVDEIKRENNIVNEINYENNQKG